MTTQLTSHDPVAPTAAPRGWATVRLLLGSVFAWAFLDKTFGLGFATAAQDAWVRGGSPTSGVLASREGTFGELVRAMAGEPWVDFAFMLGLAAVGTALLLGVALNAAAVGTILLMGSLWLASLPLENHPVVDEHVVYAAVAVALAVTGAGRAWGLGRWWAAQPLVQRHTWLR